MPRLVLLYCRGVEQRTKAGAYTGLVSLLPRFCIMLWQMVEYMEKVDIYLHQCACLSGGASGCFKSEDSCGIGMLDSFICCR